MGRIIGLWGLVVFLTGTGHYALGQADGGSRTSSVGLSVGYSLVNEELDPGVVYNPWLLLLKFEIPIEKKGYFNIYFEPQFSPVHVSGSKRYFTDFEFGLNGGIEFNLPVLSKSAYIFGAIASGPHFISRGSDLQSPGFNFSDNFAIGAKLWPLKSTTMILQCRFRHVSNLGLREPNFGLDNLFLVVGFTSKLK